MDMNDSSENVFNIPSHPLYKMDLMVSIIKEFTIFFNKQLTLKYLVLKFNDLRNY